MPNEKFAERLERMANTMQKSIDNGRRPMTQNPTPKRMREYQGRRHDADNLERTQRACRVLAECWRIGQVPVILADVCTKDAISKLVRKSVKHIDYYNIATEPDYADKSAAGAVLQSMIESSKSPAELLEEQKREQAGKLETMIEKLRFQNIDGFFPTPERVVDELIQQSHIMPGDIMLEPSAGLGSIIDGILKRYPDADVDYCEIRPSLLEILAEKYRENIKIIRRHDNFLEFHNDGYDRILMNPPFERGQDIEHICHAYRLLAPGGRLVAILSAGSLTNSQSKFVRFREWIERTGYELSDMSGEFAGTDAFRRTAVSCKLIAINRGAELPLDLSRK